MVTLKDIAKKAVDDFGIKINDSTNVTDEKFDIKYLRKAVENKGLTTGAISDEVVPAWAKIPEPTQKIPATVKLLQKGAGFWNSIKELFSRNNK